MTTPSARSPIRIVASRLVFAVGLLVVTLVGVVPSGVAEASVVDGMRMSSTTVIRVDPEVPAVFTETSYRFTNVSPDRNLGNGQIRFFFFERVIVPADPGAEFVEVTVNGRDARFELVQEDGFAYLDIDLGYRLRFDRTAEVEVKWLIVGDAPRTGASFSRVNAAYASFPVFAQADEGRADIRIEAPRNWEFDFIGSDLERSQEGTTAVFSATDIEQPLDFWAVFTARNDDALETADVTVGDAQFRVRSWPDDPEWAAFATERILDGVPALERRIGAPWPTERTTDVIETSTPYLRGYAGFYDSFADEIQVGEDLDDLVILHELSHAWFNRSDFAARWISEGLAEIVSALVLDDLGLPEPSDDFGDLPTEAFQLSRWDSFALSAGDDPREAYGYEQSYEVFRSLHAEIGDERLTAVLRALVERERPYPGPDGPEALVGPIDWRDLLDVAEQVGGSEVWVDELVDSVLISSEVAQLTQRDEAVEDYEILAARRPGWTPPEPVRDEMAAWRITRALDEIARADGALDEYDRLVEALEPTGLIPSPELETIYEAGDDDLEPFVERVREQRFAAVELVDARAELTRTLGAIGQDVPEVTQADYDDDPISIVDTVTKDVDDAIELADAIDARDDVVDRERLVVAPLDADAFVADRDVALDTVLGTTEAASAVGDVRRSELAADSFFERVGAIGADTDATIDSAIAALAAGDVDEAVDLVDRATVQIDDRNADGQRRVSVAGAGVMVLVVLLVVWRVRRRRRSGESAAPDDDPVQLTFAGETEAAIDGEAAGIEAAPAGAVTDDADVRSSSTAD